MKQLKQFCAAALLTLAIGTAAFAGDISSPAATAPPPPPGEIGSPAATSPAPGDIGTPGTTTTDSITNFTVMLLLSIL
jgi:hypothetical protein